MGKSQLFVTGTVRAESNSVARRVAQARLCFQLNHNDRQKDMKTSNKLVVLAGASFLLWTSTGQLAAQQRGGRGNFDPAEIQQRIMDSYKESLEFTKDDEWNAVKPLVEKVVEAQRDAATGRGFGAFGRGGGRGRGGDGNAQGDQGGRRGNRGGFGGQPSPELEALQKAIESKASPDEIKAKLAKYRESRKDKEAKLAKAQDDLRKVLTARQEAIAVTVRLLN